MNPDRRRSPEPRRRPGRPARGLGVKLRVTAASDSVRQGQGRAGQRTETNGVGSGRLLGVGVGWTEEGVVERGKREAEGRATEEGGGREGRSEKKTGRNGSEAERKERGANERRGR